MRKSRFTEEQNIVVFEAVAAYCCKQRAGKLGESHLILEDDNGERHRFHFATFFNQYDALTLGLYLVRAYAMVAVNAV